MLTTTERILQQGTLSSQRGSAMLELSIIFAIVMVLIFIPMTTQVLPRYQKGNITINLYESYSAYSAPENHFTNLDPQGHLVAADINADINPGLQYVANDLTKLTKLPGFCGILLKNSETRHRSRLTELVTSQDEVGQPCASNSTVPVEIINDFEAQVVPEDGVAFGSTVYHQDPVDHTLTYAHLRLSPGVENR